MLCYPVKLTKDDGTVLVAFPDFPEAHTFGEDRDEALMRAVHALMTIIEAYMKIRQRIPPPSRGRTTVEVPPLMVAKIALHNEVITQRVSKAELGRRLNWHLPQVDRVLDVRHASRLDQLEQALGAVGCRLDVSVESRQPVSAR